ncbi:MAG: hypothetical protein CMJ78_24805 [Planctomycetaceae bacterium]|nr:hypothetical protein [Planctomycetaceae bacterium]
MNVVTENISEADTRHAEIRKLVSQASGVIAHYWPMSMFVHHNPLHNIESMHFEEAVRMGRRFVGGNGYLPNEVYREYVKSGRIKPEHIDAALRPNTEDQNVTLGQRTVSHFDVLRAHLLSGNTPLAEETLEAFIDRSPHASSLRKLADHLASVLPEPEADESPLARDWTLADWCDRTLQTQLTDPMDREVIKWCEAFLDEGHAVWAMPEREKGFYHAWKSLAALEWSPCGITNSSRKIEQLPESPEEALLEHLDVLGIPEEMRQDYLSLQLTSLCGWASFINWRGELSEGHEWQETYPVDLTQYLAVRVWYERELVKQACESELGIEGTYPRIASWIERENNAANAEELARTAQLSTAVRLHDLAGGLEFAPASLTDVAPEQLRTVLDWINAFPITEHGPVWLKAFEAGYHEGVLGQIKEIAKSSAQSDETKTRPAAQVMFCIDVRSEPFRRSIESVGNYETIGFAGFFTVFIRHQAFGDHHFTEQYPAIGKAQHTTCDVVRDNQEKELARHQAGKDFFHTAHELLHDLKAHLLTPYITVESLGWIFGVPLFGRTLFPRFFRKCREKISEKVAPPVGTNVTCDRTEGDDGVQLGLTLDEQVTMLETALRSIGLTDNFARLVAACGHGSSSDNNPYEAALNCGACGGNAGTPNARVFASIGNKPEVRKQLAERGIVIPEDTHFLAGLHDTTTDGVTFFDQEDIPSTHQSDMERFRKSLREAAIRTNKERCGKLPLIADNPSAATVQKEIDRRAGDWSEVRPEWGLSGNAAFIVGRRSLTQDINLEGRSFLNNYDYREDPTGALLQGILAAPTVVVQWINSEHYFSATDPEVYGAGSKIYHNVVGRIGIMAGPQSDLRTGLARQSVMRNTMPYHEPLRLLVVAEAPRERIIEGLKNLPHVQALFDNEWIHLVAVDPEEEQPLYRYEPGLKWASLS